MSEFAPQSNSANETIDAARNLKARREQAKLEERIDAWSDVSDDESMKDFEDYLNARPTEDDGTSAYDRWEKGVQDGTITSAYDAEVNDAYAQNSEIDAAKEAFDAKIQDTITGNAKLRYARRLAKDVAEARAYQPNENDNVDQLAEDIAAKEDHIETLVSSFLDSDAAKDLSSEEKNAILDAIYNTTDAADSSETDSTSVDNETTTETAPADTEETTPTAPESDDLDEETDDEESLDEETDDETTETSPADTDTDHERETGPKAFFLRAYYRSKNAIGDFLKSKLGSDNEKAKRNRWIALGSVAAVAAAGAAAWYFTRNIGGTPMPSNPNIPSAGDLPEVNPTVPSNPNTGGLETAVDTGSTGGSEVYNFSDAARTVNPGEGWFETMQEMNIPAGSRAELLEKVGPQLEQMGAAYRDAAIGGWGMNMPANGQLSDEVLQVIANAAK